MEATGGLEMPLASELELASLPVSLVNPRQVPNFARATGRLAKTDAIDCPGVAAICRGGQAPCEASSRCRHPGAAHSGRLPATREIESHMNRKPGGVPVGIAGAHY